MITVKNISKAYNKTQALKNISFDVKKGELFGLIGPDGAGKTTLMRILMTLLVQDEGKAEMSGLDVVRDYKKIRLFDEHTDDLDAHMQQIVEQRAKERELEEQQAREEAEMLEP